MDVVVVTSLYPPHSYGGYEASCRDVVERWRRRGHRVTVLTSTTRVAGVADHPAELGVRRDLAFYWADHRLPERPLRGRVAVERGNHQALRRLLDEVRPDVVSFWSMGALSLGLLEATADRGLPMVLVVCDDWLVYGERADLWRRPLARSAVRRTLARRLTGLPTGWPSPDAAHAVYVSGSVLATAEQRAPWRPATSAVVGSGIDPVDFPVQPPVSRPWSWRLLHVGRVDPRKGIDDAVRALTHLPERATLDVVGRGDPEHRAQLEGLVDELGLAGRVRFDALPRDALADRYAAADAVLFTPTWPEPFGLVPLEAMACATPVVATGTGGSADFLSDGGNCLLVPPADPVAIAAAVTRLAGDEALRARLLAGGAATAAQHGADAYAERLEREHLAVLR